VTPEDPDAWAQRDRMNGTEEPYFDVTDEASVRYHGQKRFMESVPRRYRTATLDDVAEAVVPRWADWASRLIATDPAEIGNLILMGNVGTGKTHAAWAALRHIATTPYQPHPGRQCWRLTSFRADSHADLCASLRPGPGKETEAILRTLVAVQVLMVDDLGAIKQTEWSEEITYRLINGRYNAGLPIIATSNLTPKVLRDSIGDRIVSRLIEDATQVAITGTDRRRKAA
jgi:DNA replication protein DnaC